MAEWSNAAKEILRQRYLKKDEKGSVIESEDGMLDRVATFIASAEKQPNKWKIKFLEILDSLEFLPNSPTLMNAGKENPMLSACFVLPVSDDLAGIFESLKQGAIIHKFGGGTGFNFSQIRSKGAIVGSTKGVASGLCSFIDVYDAGTGAVKQGGARRGANLALLNITHPDIYEFVSYKQDLLKWPNFNISVAMNGDFLNRVKNNNKHILRDPHTKERKIVSSLELFNLIVHNIWTSGEPGIVFLDTINKFNPIPWCGKITGVNPCVSGDTLIMVAGDSPKPIKELVGKEFPVYCTNKRGKLVVRKGYNCRKTRENQKLFKVTLDDGSFIEATEDHTFILSNNKKCLLKDLKTGDSLMRFDREVYNWHNCNYWKVSNGNVGKFEHRYLDEYYFGKSCIKNQEVIHHKDFNGLNNLKDNLQIVSLKEHSKIHDISGERNPIFKLKKDGKFEEYKQRNPFYNTKGENNPRFGVRLTKDQIERQRKSVIETFNRENTRELISQITKEAMKEVKYKLIGNRIPREERVCFQCNNIFVEKESSKQIFCSQKCAVLSINSRRTKNKKVLPINHRVVSIEFSRIDDVYDLTVEEFFNYAVITSNSEVSQRGLIVWDCAESPLLDYESCNLGSIDVSKFFVGNDIDWNRLEKVVKISTRFLDDVIEVNKFPRSKIRRKTLWTRKIGLGIMGWADLLILMKIRYDSQKAFDLADTLMCNIKKWAVEESKEIGREKGFFPADGGRLKRRNSVLTVIAPTGTLSLLGGCSSGIEPIFSKKFTKTVLGNVKINLSDKYRSVSKEDYFTTALEISPENHIKMQAVFQKYVDGAVSKTINLPENAQEDEIKKGIFLAYDLGIKGLTFYRYGTRDAPLEISTESLSECLSGKCEV